MENVFFGPAKWNWFPIFDLALISFFFFNTFWCAIFYQEWFIGHELFDREATIVHHFAFHHDPSSFKYPLLEAGVVLSRPAIKRYRYLLLVWLICLTVFFAKCRLLAGSLSLKKILAVCRWLSLINRQGPFQDRSPTAAQGLFHWRTARAGRLPDGRC